MTGRLQNKNG